MDSLIAELKQKHIDFNDSFSARAYKHSFDFAYAYLNILEKENKIKQTGKTGHSVFYVKL